MLKILVDRAAAEVAVGPLERLVTRVKLVVSGKPVAFQPSGKTIRIPLDQSLWQEGIPAREIR